MVRAPELVLERQEGTLHRLAAIVEQLQVLEAALPAHRRGELDVQAQQVLWNEIAAGVYLLDHRRRYRDPGRQADAGHRHRDRRAAQLYGVEADVILAAGVEAVGRREPHRAVRDVVQPQHRGAVGGDRDAQERRPLIGLQPRVAQLIERRRGQSGDFYAGGSGAGSRHQSNRRRRLLRRGI